MGIILILALAVVALAFAGAGGGTKKKGRKNKARRSPASIVADLLLKARSGAVRALVRACDPNRTGEYVPACAKAAAGLIRAKRDVRRFGFYMNTAAVKARVEHLQKRAQDILAMAERIAAGEVVRSEAVPVAEAAFETFADAYMKAIANGEEPNVEDIFLASFPPEVLETLNAYAESEDPFKGSEDEADDDDETATESDDDDDETDGQ